MTRLDDAGHDAAQERRASVPPWWDASTRVGVRGDEPDEADRHG